jgi:Zn finger protein HypA/HybF involved in hydrogenase expression
MSENNRLIQQWRRKIELANQNNIFCHCRDCGEEWVDSQEEVTCAKCGSPNLEQIPCWQFPDG